MVRRAEAECRDVVDRSQPNGFAHRQDTVVVADALPASERCVHVARWAIDSVLRDGNRGRRRQLDVVVAARRRKGAVGSRVALAHRLLPYPACRDHRISWVERVDGDTLACRRLDSCVGNVRAPGAAGDCANLECVAFVAIRSRSCAWSLSASGVLGSDDNRGGADHRVADPAVHFLVAISIDGALLGLTDSLGYSAEPRRTPWERWRRL